MAHSKAHNGLIPLRRLEGVDEAGMLVSALCLVHCLSLPVLLALAPAFGSSLADPLVHRLFAVLAGLSVVAALFPSAITHGRWAIAAVGSVGTLLLLVSAFEGSDVCCSLLLALSQNQLQLGAIGLSQWVLLLLTPTGCLLVAVAHYLNRRRAQARSCRCCAAPARIERRKPAERPVDVVTLASMP